MSRELDVVALTGKEYDDLMAAKDERDDLRAHLTGIEKIANQSRSQTARMLLIAGRCRSALNGDSEWRKLPRPRKRHPLATPERAASKATPEDDGRDYRDDDVCIDDLIGGNS